VSSAVVWVIPSAHHSLLILVPELAGVEGEAHVVVGAKASSNEGIRGTFSPTRGLVDGHVLDTPHRRRVLAGVGPLLSRHLPLRLLSCRALKEHTQLVVCVMFLEQSHCGSNVLACPG
jgi:hypothetical protein